MQRLGLLAMALSMGLPACTERASEEPAGSNGGSGGATSWDPVLLRPGYYQAETFPSTLVSDGEPITVRFASQGGYAMFVGARASGLEPGTARVASELVDPEDGRALVFDGRMIEVVESADGSGDVEPDFQSSSNFSHLVPCPNYGTRPVHGVEWILGLKMGDSKVDARTGSVSVKVIPSCAEDSRYLNCLCPEATISRGCRRMDPL